MRWSFLPLGKVIVLAVAGLGLFGATVLLGTVSLSLQKRVKTDVQITLRDTVATARDRLIVDLADHQRSLALGRDLQALSEPSAKALRSRLKHLNQLYPEYAWVAYISASGRVLAASQGIAEGVSVSSQVWFKQALSMPQISRTGLRGGALDSIEGDILPGILILSQPVKNAEGRSVGVLAAGLSRSWLAGVLQPFARATVLRQGYDLMVVDQDGRVVFGPADLDGKVLLSPAPAVLTEQDGPVHQVQSVLNPDFLTYLSAPVVVDGVGAFPWFVGLQAEPARAYALAGLVHETVLWAAVPVMILFGLVGIFFARRLVRPIEMLERAVSNGTEIPPCTEFRETAALATAFRTVRDHLSTEQKKFELLADERNARLRDVTQVCDAHAIVSMTDAQGTIVFCNDRFCEISGYSREELIGQNHRIVRSDIHPRAFYADLWNTIRSGRIWQGLICNYTKSGKPYWVQSTIAPVSPQGDDPVRYVSIRTDITEAILGRQRLKALSDELTIFHRLVEETDEAISVLDKDKRYIYVNPARERLMGIPASDLVGQLLSETSPLWSDEQENAVCSSLAKGHAWNGLLPMERADGTSFIAFCGLVPIMDEQGNLQYICNIFHDHTSQMTFTRELEETRDQAIKANQAKSDFLSNMSHELRTPLNAILGFTQLLLSNRKTPPTDRQREQLGHIQQGGQHLLELINDVLDLTKIEAGRLSLSSEPTDLVLIVHECVGLIDGLLDENRLALTFEEEDDLPPVMVDVRRCKQVILNLLSNAVKYNRPGGAIHVRIARASGRKQDAMVRLSIQDNGIGISTENLRQLFEPFNRLKAENSSVQGTGIGLALSRRIMESMNGMIGVSSVDGEGSTFWLEFRTASDGVMRAMPEPFEAPLLLPAQPRGGKVSEVSSVAGELPTHVRLLYVEDDPDSLQVMQALMPSLPGFDLTVAHSFEDGLYRAQVDHPDLILVAFDMVEMGSIDMISALKSLPSMAGIPVVAIASEDTASLREAARGAGCCHLLVRPIQTDGLLSVVRQNLSVAPDTSLRQSPSEG